MVRHLNVLRALGLVVPRRVTPRTLTAYAPGDGLGACPIDEARRPLVDEAGRCGFAVDFCS